MDRPVIVLDVNETLSDLSALTPAFEAEGAAGALAQTWFAATLRDGFALTMVGESRSFAEVGRPVLLGLLAHVEGLLDEPADAADAILRAFAELPPHDDVAAGITALAAAGHRIVTLSNGAGANARALVERAGVADLVERHLGVEDTGVMKPHPDAYRRGSRRSGSNRATPCSPRCTPGTCTVLGGPGSGRRSSTAPERPGRRCSSAPSSPCRPSSSSQA